MDESPNRQLLELEQRFEQSRRRSTARRGSGPRRPLAWPGLPVLLLVVAVLAGLAVSVAALVGGGVSNGPSAQAAERARPIAARTKAPAPRAVPSPAAMRDAWSYARRRGGLVSIAVVDDRGRLRGRREDRNYVSASVVKSMLLAAELDRLEQAGAPLDPVTEATLRAMITYSDNAAADEIYYRVGDEGLYGAARSVGMERFTVSGYWANAEITAADMARYFANLDRALEGPNRKFALGLLGSVIAEQSWGIPDAAGESWAVRFKGGWRTTELGSLVHQAAQLRHRDQAISIAVLTDGQPSQPYAIKTVRGVAERLLDGQPAAGEGI